MVGHKKWWRNIGIGDGRGRVVDTGNVDVDICRNRGQYRCCNFSIHAYIWNVNRIARMNKMIEFALIRELEMST